MAVAVECYSLIGLVERADEKYPGGVEALLQAARNSSALRDEQLWRAAFMAESDARRFAEQLRSAGLETVMGGNPDFVGVDEFEQIVEPFCEWIQVTKIQNGVIAWLAGTVPENVSATPGWSFEHGSGMMRANDEDLEFLRHEGSIAVYFNKKENKEVYITRAQHDPEEVFQVASKVIIEHMRNPGRPALSEDKAVLVRKAIADLEPIARKFPESWRVLWVLAIGNNSLGDKHKAQELLLAAWELEQTEECIPRDLAGLCLELNHLDQAVEFSQKAAAIKPDHAETLGNLACVYLIAGKLAAAKTTIEAALRIKPDDRSNLYLQKSISEVTLGKRPQPQSLEDMNVDQSVNPPQLRKRSWWQRCLDWFYGQ